MENSSDPASILSQVEALFSAIETLPVELRGEALKKIKTKLGSDKAPSARATEKTSKESEKNHDEKDEQDENNTAGKKKKKVTKRVRKPKAAKSKSKASVDAEETVKSKESVDAEETAKSKESVDAEETAKSKESVDAEETAKSKKSVDVEETAKSKESVDAEKSPSKVAVTRRSKRKAVATNTDDQAGDEAGGTNEQETAHDSLADDAGDETPPDTAAKKKPKRRPRSARKKKTDDDGEGKDKSEKEPLPYNVYRIPSDVNIRHINQRIEELCDESEKKIKGQKIVYGCTVCDKKFTSKSLIKVHMRTHTGEKPYVCHMCSKAFTQSGALSVHLKRHQGLHDYFCKLCDYKSVGKIDMLRHEARHRGEKNFFCDICGKQFTTDTSLKDHIKHVHERSNTYVCQICAFTTHRADNLRRHISIRHSNKENMQCPVCQVVIKQRSSFITHMRTHTGERPHQCPKCDKAFKNHSQVAAHMRCHQEGAFVCDVCLRRFKTRFHLRRHTLVHTGEKPFGCMYCSYSCNVKGNINKHVRFVHNIPDFSFRTLAANEEADADVDSQEVVETIPGTEPSVDEVREKGAAFAKEFLQKMSLRREEQLTVEDLQKDMEEKKRQRKIRLESAVKGDPTGAPKRKKGAAGSKRQSRKKKKSGTVAGRQVQRISISKPEDEDELQARAEEEDQEAMEMSLQEAEQSDFNELQIEDVGEEHVISFKNNDDSGDGETTLIIPPNGYICVEPSALEEPGNIPVAVPLLSADEDKMATTTVYLIHCGTPEELLDTMVE